MFTEQPHDSPSIRTCQSTQAQDSTICQFAGQEAAQTASCGCLGLRG